MIYRFEGYLLHASTRQLLRQGLPLEVPKRVFDCMRHLIEHRDRAVHRDELIRDVWGRDNVSDNQLAHVVRAARRLLNDDGAAQRLIRTIPGLGYHWVGEVLEAADPIVTHQEQAMTQAIEVVSPASLDAADAELAAFETSETSAPQHMVTSASQPRAAVVAWYLSGKVLSAAALVLVLVSLASINWPLHKAEPAAATPSQVAAPATAAAPLTRLEEALWQGKYEKVREGLAILPADLADSREARLLDTRLDIERGRFDRATQKLTSQLARAKALNDPVWQAKLLTTQSFLNGSAGKPGLEVLKPAQLAITLLESAGRAASPQAMGEALSAQGYGFMKIDQLEPAVRDLVHARALQLKAGDAHGGAYTTDTLARVQMRMGRFTDALALMTEIANYCQQSDAPVLEIYALTAATKIQVELLRWDDALASSDRSMQLLQKVPDSERRTRVVLSRALVLTGMGRLREATSLIEEGAAMHDERYSSIIPATYHLASGKPEQALAEAVEAYEFTRYGTNDTLNLESKEGALLLWMIAAQDLAASGKTIPLPSPAQFKALQQPESSIGHIARGRWLRSQGKSHDAEVQFRLALARARQMGHLSRMLQSSEPLIELLLQRGDTTAAEQVLAELQGYDPVRIAQDYSANLLSLRVALALGQKTDIAAAYKRTTALAGERALPDQVLLSYKASIRSIPSKQEPLALGDDQLRY